MIRRAAVFFAVVCILGALTAASARSETTNPVRRIDMDGLESLLAETDNAFCLLAVMASWCKPCKEELPTLVGLGRKYKSLGLSTIGLSLDYAGPAAMQPVIDALNVDFPVYWAGERPMKVYNITAIPALLFFRNGRVVESVVGKNPTEFIEEKIRALLETKAESSPSRPGEAASVRP